MIATLPGGRCRRPGASRRAPPDIEIFERGPVARSTRGATVAQVYFWDGWQCVEETDASGTLVKQYVYGEGIDEVLRANLPDAADLDSDMDTSEKIDLYYHQNSLGSVAAVTDAAGALAESYAYSAYGDVSIFDSGGSATSGNVTEVEQPFMFTGRRWDFEEGSGLYYYRLRYYDPASGRFVSRDPLGLWGDPGQRGNGQSYCGNNPVNRVDPMGDKFVDHKGRDFLEMQNPTGFAAEVKQALIQIFQDLVRNMREAERDLEKLQEEIRADRDPDRQRDLCGRMLDSGPAGKGRDFDAELAELEERLARAKAALDGFVKALKSPIEVEILNRNKNQFNGKRAVDKDGNEARSGHITWQVIDRDSDGVERPTHIGLAHEIGHAIDYLFDPVPMADLVKMVKKGEHPFVVKEPVEQAELWAVEFENEVRNGYRAGPGGHVYPPDRTTYIKH